MGTRNLTSVVKNGETKIAQYGQWDGYPEGQGNTILKFLHGGGLRGLEANLPRCRFISPQEAEQGDLDIQAGRKSLARDFPLLDRDHGAEVLRMIAEDKGSGPLLLQDNSSFATDGLFCEWAYTLDLDTQSLRVYKSGTRLLRSYSLSDLPQDFSVLQKELAEEEDEY